MQQSDYILREIEKIGAMIMGIVGKMIRKRDNEIAINEDEFAGWMNKLNEEGSLDLDELINTDAASLDKVMDVKKGYNEANIELVADLLVELAANPIVYSPDQLYRKALEIYQFLDSSMKTFSFERTGKMKKLNELLG